MVLLASSSRSLARSLGPAASRLRAFHSSSSASRPSLSAAAQAALRSQTAAARAPRPFLGSAMSKTSVRMLTTQREKVKVLLVLYDGGQHAKDVSLALLYSA